MRKGGIGIILHPPIVSARLSPPSLGAFQSPFADLLSSLTLLLIWHAPIFIRHPSDLGSITCRQIVETTVLLVRGEIRISIWDSWGGMQWSHIHSSDKHTACIQPADHLPGSKYTPFPPQKRNSAGKIRLNGLGCAQPSQPDLLISKSTNIYNNSDLVCLMVKVYRLSYNPTNLLLGVKNLTRSQHVTLMY